MPADSRAPRLPLRASDLRGLALLAQTGTFGLGSSEHIGGAGFSLVEEMLVFTALGRHLVTPSALATTIAGRMAQTMGHPDMAADIVAGRLPVCPVIAAGACSFESVDGTPAYLLDAHSNGLALLWNTQGLMLFHVHQLPVSGRVAGCDRSVVLDRSTLSEAALIGKLRASDSQLSLEAQWRMAAQVLGIAEATCTMAVDYAKVRKQFGQPIGAFQAIKHACADMLVQAEVLRAQACMAAIALRDGWADAAFQVEAFRILATGYALDNARRNIQVHGAMGFTAECDAHHYLLRAHLYEHLGGSIAEPTGRMTELQPVPSM